MPELVRQWPSELAHIVKHLHGLAGRQGCYAAEVDLSEDEMRALNLFQASARHEHVMINDPDTSEECYAYLNTPVGLGPPKEREGCIGRVRISLTDVHPH
jgi:hypothetical protein